MNEEYLYDALQKALSNKLDEPRSEKFKDGILTAKSIVRGVFKRFQRTKQEVLKDFEKMGYEVVRNDDDILLMRFTGDIGFRTFTIYKDTKEYNKMTIIKNQDYVAEITLEEHKLLSELFAIWGVV